MGLCPYTYLILLLALLWLSALAAATSILRLDHGGHLAKIQDNPYCKTLVLASGNKTFLLWDWCNLRNTGILFSIWQINRVTELNHTLTSRISYWSQR